jgi:hypothetical protein
VALKPISKTDEAVIKNRKRIKYNNINTSFHAEYKTVFHYKNKSPLINRSICHYNLYKSVAQSFSNLLIIGLLKCTNDFPYIKISSV